MPDIAHKPHPHADFLRFSDGMFSGAHRRKVAECAVAVQNRRCRRFVQDAELRTRVMAAVFKAAAVTVHRPSAVAADTAQIGVHQQPTDEGSVFVR